jgi:hypothetical protein
VNIFDESIASGKITNEHELKVLFWTLAKKLHPDITASDTGERAFVQLKENFDEAAKRLIASKLQGAAPSVSAGAGPARAGDIERCRSLFSDLIASNFPTTKKEGNKKYASRIAELNDEINLFGKAHTDLLVDSEKELLGIRGDSIVSNHAFNLIHLYFYNMSDCFITGNYFSRLYLRNSYRPVIACLRERNASRTVQLIDWLLSGLAQ